MYVKDMVLTNIKYICAFLIVFNQTIGIDSHVNEVKMPNCQGWGLTYVAASLSQIWPGYGVNKGKHPTISLRSVHLYKLHNHLVKCNSLVQLLFSIY